MCEMNITQDSTAKRAPNGEQRRSQDLTVDLKLLYALNHIFSSMYKQWAVVKRLIETGDAKGVALDSVDDSLFGLDDEITQLESLLRRK